MQFTVFKTNPDDSLFPGWNKRINYIYSRQGTFIRCFKVIRVEIGFPQSLANKSYSYHTVIWKKGERLRLRSIYACHLEN